MAAIRRINAPGTFARIGLNLPTELRDWLQLQAVKDRTTASEIVAQALAEYRRRGEKPVPRKKRGRGADGTPR